MCRYFCRLFDIVGLDEGTCGRRLAGSDGFKASDTRSKLKSFSYVLHVSIRNGRSFAVFGLRRSSEAFCVERLLEMIGVIVEFHCDCAGT